MEDPGKYGPFPPLKSIPGAWRAAGHPSAEICLPPDATMAPQGLVEAVFAALGDNLPTHGPWKSPDVFPCPCAAPA